MKITDAQMAKALGWKKDYAPKDGVGNAGLLMGIGRMRWLSGVLPHTPTI